MSLTTRPTVPATKIEVAEQIAASSVDEVSVVDARRIIESFLEWLARCPACDNTGQFVYGRDVDLAIARDHTGKVTTTPVKAGSNGPCPRCANGKGDPQFVAWHCFRDEVASECERRQGREPNGEHAECGWRLVLPLRLIAASGS